MEKVNFYKQPFIKRKNKSEDRNAQDLRFVSFPRSVRLSSKDIEESVLVNAIK